MDTGADKDEALSKYKDKEYYWIEDKVENAVAGLKYGLSPILIEHGFNMNYRHIPNVKNWKELYDLIV